MEHTIGTVVLPIYVGAKAAEALDLVRKVDLARLVEHRTLPRGKYRGERFARGFWSERRFRNRYQCPLGAHPGHRAGVDMNVACPRLDGVAEQFVQKGYPGIARSGHLPRQGLEMGLWAWGQGYRGRRGSGLHSRRPCVARDFWRWRERRFIGWGERR